MSARIRLAFARWRLQCLLDERLAYSGLPVVGQRWLVEIERQEEHLRCLIATLECGLSPDARPLFNRRIP